MNQTHIHMVSLAVCPPQTVLAVMVAVCFGFAFSLFLLYTLGKRFHKDGSTYEKQADGGAQTQRGPRWLLCLSFTVATPVSSAALPKVGTG